MLKHTFFTASSVSPLAWLAFTTVFSFISHIYFLREGSWTCCFCGWWKNRQFWPMNSDFRTIRSILAWLAHMRGLKKHYAIFHKDKSSLGKYSIISLYLLLFCCQSSHDPSGWSCNQFGSSTSRNWYFRVSYAWFTTLNFWLHAYLLTLRLLKLSALCFLLLTVSDLIDRRVQSNTPNLVLSQNGCQRRANAFLSGPFLRVVQPAQVKPIVWGVKQLSKSSSFGLFHWALIAKQRSFNLHLEPKWKVKRSLGSS